MSYATVAPGQSSIPGAGPPTCANCTTLTTPLWRRDDDGNVLCNACGLFLKLHGKARPISLKTDTIKSRNRVKTAGGQPRKKEFLPAAHPAASSSPSTQLPPHARLNNGDLFAHADANNLANRIGGNIAPQHMFDGATLGDGSGTSAGASFANLFDSTHTSDLGGNGTGSPSMTTAAAAAAAAAAAGVQQNQFETNHMSYDDLRESHAGLQTRVSELELINSMFRERCTQLEAGERDSRGTIEALMEREKELMARIEALESESGRTGSSGDGELDAQMGAAAKRALDELNGQA